MLLVQLVLLKYAACGGAVWDVLTRISAPISLINPAAWMVSSRRGEEEEWARTEQRHPYHAAAENHHPSILHDYMSRWAPVYVCFSDCRQRCADPGITTQANTSLQLHTRNENAPKMVRIAKALGLVILCVAVLILSLISYVSLRKDSLFSSSKYYMGGPRIMFHAGFRWVRFFFHHNEDGWSDAELGWCKQCGLLCTTPDFILYLL